MGFSSCHFHSAPEAPEAQELGKQPLWKRWRHCFPVTQRLIYLNHAGVSPLCLPAAKAMQQLIEDAVNFGAFHYDSWVAVYDGLRSALARLINASPAEIALTKNTSEGLAMVASGLPWRPGDVVVGFAEEFPANYFPWKWLERRGVRTRWLSIYDPLDKIDHACRGARLLAISFVQYLSGHRADLVALGEICERNGCLFVVDAIQGLGAFPVDVRAARIHALACGGHKWLLGPEGCGFLFVHADLHDRIQPAEIGWTNFARYTDYANRDATLRLGAARYECGTLNTLGCLGLKAAVEFLLEVGLEKISGAIQDLTRQLADGSQAKGYRVLGERTPETSSGILSIRKEGLDPHHLVDLLASRNIIAAQRQGYLRLSPHFYVSPDEIAQVLDALP